MSEIKKYPKSLIILHWITVILVAFEFYKGFTMEEHKFNEANFDFYKSHAILGVIIMIITIIRLIIKRKNINNLPADISYYSEGHQKLVETATKLMYFLLITAPIVGFVMVYQTGAFGFCFDGQFPADAHFNETLETLHKYMVFGLGGLIFMHVSGVIMYKIKTGENLIKRMCLLIK